MLISNEEFLIFWKVSCDGYTAYICMVFKLY